jgi:hypothetical protein
LAELLLIDHQISLHNPSFCLCIIISTFSSHRFYCFLKQINPFNR